MELDEAFQTVFNREAVRVAISCMRDNSQQAGEMLLEKLKQTISDLKTRQPEAQGYDPVPTNILYLLKELDIKCAYPYLLELLQSGQCSQFFQPQAIEVCLSALIPDENSLLELKNSIINGTLCEAGRTAAFSAVVDHVWHTGKAQELELFFSDLLASFRQKPLENFEDYSLLFSVIELSIKSGYADLMPQFRELLIQLIIRSKSGSDAERFKDYFRYLYRLDPLIAARIHDSAQYIQKLLRCTDEEIFQFDNLVDVGKFLYEKTLGAAANADPDIVRLAIKQLRQYPYNNRPQPSADEDYYRELCAYLELNKLPQTVYQQAEAHYRNIFLNRYPALTAKLQALIEQTKTAQESVDADSTAIIDRANGNHSVCKAVAGDMLKLVRNELRTRELNSLCKPGPSGDAGILIFFLKELERFFRSFSGDLHNQEAAAKKLREISAQCASSDSTKVDDYFSQYDRVLRQMDTLVAEDPFATLQNIFYQVKFIPFAEAITRKYRSQIFSAEEAERDSIARQMQDEAEQHPLCPASLMACAKKSLNDYAEVLERFSGQAAESIRKALADSICLNRRGPVIRHCLTLIEQGENELAINLLPVQMEGLFADLLEYTVIYEHINDIGRYKSTLNLELVQKIDYGKNSSINIPFNAVAYFKYYFNSVIRNTVAHGNYSLLLERSGIPAELQPSDGNRETVKRVLALELLLDLNYLITVISEINEIDTAIKYIEEAARWCTRREAGQRPYDCLFDDLNGTRNRLNMTGYKFGLFVTYDGMQIFYWIFNPYYEAYMDAGHLDLIRNTVCSAEFWKYVKERLQRPHRINERPISLRSIVKGMFSLQKDPKYAGLLAPETMELLKEVSQLLRKTQA